MYSETKRKLILISVSVKLSGIPLAWPLSYEREDELGRVGGRECSLRRGKTEGA